MTINGAISGSGNILRSAGGGTTTFTTDNAYTGSTTVSQSGNLVVSDPAGGTQGTGLSDVAVSGNLRGSGEVGDVDLAATSVIFVGPPGTTPGKFSIESLASVAGATIRYNINGAMTAGNDYDQLVVTGPSPSDTIDLGGVILPPGRRPELHLDRRKHA